MAAWSLHPLLSVCLLLAICGMRGKQSGVKWLADLLDGNINLGAAVTCACVAAAVWDARRQTGRVASCCGKFDS
jgi:hypothetical protein